MSGKQSPAVSAKITVRIIGAVFALFSIFIMMLGTKTINSTKEMQDKCTAVTTAEIIRYEKSVSTSSGGRNSAPSTRISYTPVYEFAVNGKVYTHEDGGSTSGSKPYEIGKEVQIHYEPENPNNSYLKPVNPAAKYVILGLGGVFLLIGILALTGVLDAKQI